MTELERKIQNIERGLVAFKPGHADQNGIPRCFALSERMAFYNVPGVSIALINDCAVEWTNAYGVLKAGDVRPVTTESIFQAASSTKLLTSSVLLHYVEQGKMELDRDVNEYLKSWKIPQSDFTLTEKVTLRRLLTHQSGLNRPDDGFSCEDDRSPSLVQWLSGERPAQNQPALVEYVPGAKWQYSNMGFLVIQAVLEDILGKSFNQIARDAVLEPLGMDLSTLEYPLKGVFLGGEAMPHDAVGLAHEPELMGLAVAHGGLMTTPRDFALLAVELMRAYRGESNCILSQDMAWDMFHYNSEYAPDVGGFDLRQGLGVFLRGGGESFSFLHPGGNEPGTTCWIEGLPKLGVGIVIMANGARGDVLSLEIVPAIRNEYLD